MAERLKVVVIDDDPTGSQTVHGCPLLLRWDQASLRQGLAHPSPLLFLLANTRALAPEAAAERVRQICAALQTALPEAQAAGQLDRWLIVSRGDSTLRGHFPLEVEVITAAFGPYDATLLAPAFLPGGRTTVAGMHLLHGQPLHDTAFARDRLYGYRSGFLPAWVEEKSGGRWPAAGVKRLSLAELDAAAAGAAGFEQLLQRLAALEGNPVLAVDAERPEQLGVLGEAVRQLSSPAAAQRWGRPRRFLCQSAASLINGLVPLPPPARSGAALASLRRRDSAGVPLPGLVLVGSHVPLADAQLAALLQAPGCVGLEIPVQVIAERLAAATQSADVCAELEQPWLAELRQLLRQGCTPVLHTSRGEVACGSAQERRRLGLVLAGLMARLAGQLAPQLGYILSKGGITSHTLLAEGLQLPWVELQGQLMPGLSLVLTPPEAPEPGLPVITFPGNLGDASSLLQAWQLMER